jgi:solute carrier family 35 protein F1/2
MELGNRYTITFERYSIILGGLMACFALALFFMYSFTPYMMVWGSATVFNLSLLTSDVFAIIISIFMFDAVVSKCVFFNLT